MGTNIVGDFSRAELAAVSRELQNRFDSTFEYNVGERTGTWRLGFMAYGQHVSLYAKLESSVRDYFPTWPDKALRRLERSGYHEKIGFLIPHHGFAYVGGFYRRILDEGMPSWQEDFAEIGYISRERELGLNWRVKDTRALMKDVRDSSLRKVTVDRRTTDIVDALVTNLDPAPDVLRLAEYVTRNPRVTKAESDYDDDEIEKFPKFVKVRSIVDARARWAGEKVNKLYEDLFTTRAIGIASNVRVGEREYHIPMIDFSANCSEERAMEVLGELQIPGILVDSGNSYHFYGFELLAPDEWQENIASLEEMFGVCKKWPGLQLRQEFAMLRVTPAKTKLFQPCIVREFRPEIRSGDAKRRRRRRAA